MTSSQDKTVFTPDDLKREAQRHGATVTHEGGVHGWRRYQVEAPEGSVWCDGGISSIKVEWQEHGSHWRQDRTIQIADAMARMRAGLIPEDEA